MPSIPTLHLREVTGPIDFIHQFVDMEQYTLSDGSKTCTAAMGYSFAAGTADGPSTLLPHVSENWHRHEHVSKYRVTKQLGQNLPLTLL